jgi:homocysteine S-methyltransferase
MIRAMRSSPTTPADPIAEFLSQRPLLLLDGALATELESRGADLRDPLWSAKSLIERPQLIKDVHRDYFDAGADLATTATYQASFEGFGRRGIDREHAGQLMRLAVDLAVAARDEFWTHAVHANARIRPLVAASVGPYGAMLADGSEYHGRYGVDARALRDFHRPRIAVLAASGADLLAFETIPSLIEALALAEVLKEFPQTVAWMSFSCRDDRTTCEGQDIGECAARLSENPQIAAIGVNCTAPDFVRPLLERLRENTRKPLLAYPNSGEHYDADEKRWHGDGAHEDFATAARTWHAAGARLIGGCCRTSPKDIRAIKAWAALA